ncbi:MAG: SRPBCC domain-containing protein [Cyclobacteriaceae bacterium]|nr:SRPBCC domain-containing protein [Cyclobacteriaceae bacterium HetDA_MAG_MS6]
MVLADRSIRKQAVIPAEIHQVWDRWTTETGIKKFLAKECSVQMQIGGDFEMYFLLDNPKGLQGSEGCKILSYLPQRMLTFSWNAPPEYAEVRGQHTWVVLEFEELPAYQTEILLTHLGWQEGEEWNEVFQYFDQAWDQVIKWLIESFQ